MDDEKNKNDIGNNEEDPQDDDLGRMADIANRKENTDKEPAENAEVGKVSAEDTDTDDEQYAGEHKGKSEKNPKKRRIVIFTIIAAVVILSVIVAVTDSGFIGEYKQNIAANTEKLLDKIGISLAKNPQATVAPVTNAAENTASSANKREETEILPTPEATGQPEYKTKTDSSVIVPIERASESEFAAYKKGIVCARTNHISYITEEGTTEWEKNTTVIDPILKVNGDYVLIVQKNGTKICLYNNDKLLYDLDSDDNILTCNVNDSGDVVIATTRQSYKGALSVYNKNGEKIFAWSSGSGQVLDADISSGSRRVAASVINTSAKVYSSILLFNINKADAYQSDVFDDTILFNVKFCGSNVNAFGDNSMVGVSTSGTILYDKRFDDVELTHYSVDEDGTKLMLFVNDNIPMMNVYNKSGVLKYTVVSEKLPDYTGITGYNLLYNNDRDIFLGKPNSKSMYRYTAPMDIKRLILIDSRTFAVIYSNSAELIKMS